MIGGDHYQPGVEFGGGRFKIVKKLGEGGMGIVCLAEDATLHENVAVKFLSPQLSHDHEAMDDMRRETRKCRQLSHRNIIRIHDFYQLPGEAPFITMEYIEGQSLSALKAGQPNRLFPWPTLVPIVAQLCDALDYAHEEKIVHRDLKPANMLLDAKGRLKLADFGLAATLSESMLKVTKDMGVSGTPSYMSPQQLAGKPSKATDDIYSLGATLFELLTSKPPFYKGDVLHQIREGNPPTLAERLKELDLKNEIPEAVAATIMACLNKDAAVRPQTAGEVAERMGITKAPARRASHASVSGAAPSDASAGSAKSSQSDSRPRPTQDSSAPTELEFTAPSAPFAPAGSGKGKLYGIIGGVAVLLLIGLAVVFRPRKPAEDPPPTAAAPASGVAKPAVPSVAAVVAKPTSAPTTTASRWTNSLGQVFVPVPGTEVLFCVWETRVQDYAAFASATGRAAQKPSFEQGPTHPVVHVNWDDAQAFAKWLTEKERQEGKLSAGQSYRLPMDWEWSVAVGLNEPRDGTPVAKSGKIANVYPWGRQWPPPPGAGNFADQTSKTGWPMANYNSGGATCIDGYQDGHAFTSPVGNFMTNSFGLYDMAGNVWQWCEDWYDDNKTHRVLRGGSWHDAIPEVLLSSHRWVRFPPDRKFGSGGFRLVLTGFGGAPAAAVPSPSVGKPAAPPVAAGVPNPASAPPTTTSRWTNTLGQVFVPVPGTEVQFCIWDTRVQDYAAFAAATSRSVDKPPFKQEPTHPVVSVSWDDAQAFTKWLTEKERKDGKLTATQSYRLPKDWEWSVAAGLNEAREGSPNDKHVKIKGMYPWGVQWPPPRGAANLGQTLNVDDYEYTSPVGSFAANRFGIYDMGGNVWQWCEDFSDGVSGVRVSRGGSWRIAGFGYLLSSYRQGTPADTRNENNGFRCVLVGMSSR